MGRRCGTYEAGQVLAHHVNVRSCFSCFQEVSFLLSSMSFFSLLIALNTENTYSRYQIECKRLNVSLNRTLYLMMISDWSSICTA